MPSRRAPPLASSEPNHQTHWFALLVFETIFNGFCVAYFFGTMAREQAVLAYQQASLTDVLTGVANRRGFFERGELLLRRAVLDGRTAAVMVFDLDRFKEINDTLGHHAGDRILECFSRVAASVLRANDLIGRIGGEEFACIVIDSSHGEAMRIAERVRSEFAAAAAAADPVARDATVSIGVAMSGDGLQDLNALIKAADQALYRAKEQGRNRVEMSPVTPLLARRRPAGA